MRFPTWNPPLLLEFASGCGYPHALTLPEAAVSARTHPLTNKTDENGPFDIIGDVHGCYEELCELLVKLGYEIRIDGEGFDKTFSVTAPVGRTAVFVGDLVDRGPASPNALSLVMAMVDAGQAYCVCGNHDDKFLRWLDGRDVQMTYGLAESVEQMEGASEDFRNRARGFLGSLEGHYMFDGSALAVAHAGITEELQGQETNKARSFCLYGKSSGEKDQFGLPVRYNWAADYSGVAMVVYGHTPVPEAVWLNNTICIDTGCVFGGKLTALRYPERELISVPAERVYAEPARPWIE